MTKDDLILVRGAVLALPLSDQAECLRLAAVSNAGLWNEWCRQRQCDDHAGKLLDTFELWRTGNATDEELRIVGRELFATLPQDIPKESAPPSGYAGWALFDIAVIALNDCEDVHSDILHTAMLYAAAAHCRMGVESASVRLDRLTECELSFLDSWWRKCCEKFPAIAKAVPNPNSN